MHVGDYMFIFCLALILFGPKKLPEIGRQIGKLMVEFRRASNEFKMQIEEELRASEEAERQKEITATKTMLPATVIGAAASTGGSIAAESATADAAIAEPTGSAGIEAKVPVIAPPSTGLPVNHTFVCPEDASRAAEAAETAAYPEAADDASFNPALNTASNGEIAEAALAGESPVAAESTQAAVHHG